MAPKNKKKKFPEIKTVAAPLSGCTNYRMGLVLTALNQRLAENPPPEEAKILQAEIEAIEAQMGF